MAKLRRNYEKKRGGTSNAVRMGVFAAVLIGGLYFLWGTLNSKEEHPLMIPAMSTENRKVDDPVKSMLPVSSTGEVIEHTYYTLSYSEEHEQAEWVAYPLTKESIRMPNVKRSNWFNPDKKVKNESAVHSDYRGSGYSRGHLAPAGDMAFNKKAMKESMFMSNMSPQVREFNQGIWNELELSVRNWAWDNKEVYVVTGPVLSRGHIIKQIGHNKVSVPDSYFKIVMDHTSRNKKAIAFIIPNEVSTRPLKEYAVTIDEVEALTGIDFFSDAFEYGMEERLESRFDVNQWRWEQDLYDKRVNKWNHQ